MSANNYDVEAKGGAGSRGQSTAPYFTAASWRLDLSLWLVETSTMVSGGRLWGDTHSYFYSSMRNGILISPIISIPHRSWQLTNYYKLCWYAAEKICGPHLSLWVWSHFLPQWAKSAIFFRVIFAQCNHSQFLLMHLIIFHTTHEIKVWCMVFSHCFSFPKFLKHTCKKACCTSSFAHNFKVEKWILCMCAQKLASSEVRLAWLFYEIWGWALQTFLGQRSFYWDQCWLVIP